MMKVRCNMCDCVFNAEPGRCPGCCGDDTDFVPAESTRAPDPAAEKLAEENKALRRVIETACVCRHDPGQPVMFGEYRETQSGDSEFIPPKSLPSIPLLMDELKKIAGRDKFQREHAEKLAEALRFSYEGFLAISAASSVPEYTRKYAGARAVAAREALKEWEEGK